MATQPVTKAQIRAIRSIAHGRLGWDDDGYHRWLRERGGPASTTMLTRAQAANVIDMLQDLRRGARLRIWRVDQATVRQRAEIDRLVARLGPRDREHLPGIVSRATHGQCRELHELSIWHARDLIDALRSIAGRRRRRTA